MEKTRLPLICLALGLALVILSLLGYQFYRMGQIARPLKGELEARQSREVRPKRYAVKSVKPKKAEPTIPDLEGQREPTQEELIRYAIEHYLAEIRAAVGKNIDKVMAYPKNKAELQALLRSLPPEAVPIIAELLREETDPLCRRILIYGLADIGTDEAAAVLRDWFLEHINDPSYGSEMRHLVRALGRCRADYAFQTLKDFLNEKENGAIRELRPHYVEAMSKHRLGYQAVPIFVDLVKNDGSDVVRNAAAQGIKNVAKREPLPSRVIFANLKESFEIERQRQSERAQPVPYVEQTILGTIGQLGDPKAIPFLVEVGTTAEFPIQLSAAAALARIGGEEAIQGLEEVFNSCPNKRKFVEAIGELKEPKALPFLVEVVLSSEDEAVKKRAIIGITRVGGLEAVEALQQILTSEEVTGSLRKEVEGKLARLLGSRS